MYLLLEPSEFFADMQGMLPATLSDIESEMISITFTQKKQKQKQFKAIKSAVYIYSEFCALN